jgi:NAD-dependent deacetylase
LLKSKPNAGHTGLAELEKHFDVEIITQNVDDLHERAGSSKVLHLHGELKKVRSTQDPSLVHELGGWELKRGDTCEKGFQLRPHIVWFGEAVPLIEDAVEITQMADAFAVIGTSLLVYPAAGLVDYVPSGVPIYLVDPNEIPVPRHREVDFIKEKASSGLPILKERLLKRFIN